MNLLLQIGIVLSFLFLGLTITFIKQKRFKGNNIAVIAAIFIFGVLFSYLGIRTSQNFSSDDVGSAITEAGKYISDAQYEKAHDVLNLIYKNNHTDSPMVLIYLARLESLEGNIKLAGYYYSKAMACNDIGRYFNRKQLKGIKAEIKLLEDSSDTPRNSGQGAVIQYLVDKGQDPYAYYDKATVDAYNSGLLGNKPADGADSRDTYINTITGNIDDELNKLEDQSDACHDTAYLMDLYFYVQAYYDSGLTAVPENAPDGIDSIEKVIRKLAEYRGDAAARSLNIDDLLIKVYIKSGDVDKALDIIKENPNSKNTAVLSELYMKGYVVEGDIEGMYGGVSEDGYDSVMSQYETVTDRLRDKAETEEDDTYIDYLDGRLAVMESESEHIGLAQIKDSIDGAITDVAPEKKSNYYLQSAKIDQFFSDETGMKSEFENALQYAPYSDDELLAAGLNGLNGIVSGGTGDVKDIPAYVQQAVDSSLEMDVVIPPNTQDTAAGSDNPDTAVSKSFEQSLSDYVSEKMVQVNINKIDTGNYPQITAYVQLGSSNDASYISKTDLTKKNIDITDTGVTIKDYSIEKVQYDEADIVLCFDMSGSMAEEVDDLKDAGYKFVDSMSEIEKVALVGFSDDIIIDSPFSGNPDELRPVIDTINSNYGTNMYSAIQYSLGKFTKKNVNNILIMLTDGCDTSNTPLDQTRETVRSQSISQGATVYAIGLGNEVDANYLQTVADAGNGKFVYVSDAESLKSFYDFLHGQITNQYKITYTVSNEGVQNRELDVEFKTLNGSDTKPYRVGNEDVADQGYVFSDEEPEDANVCLVSNDGQVTISGLDRQPIIKTKGRSYNLVLNGTGFLKLNQKDISIELRGPGNPDMEDIKIIDDTHIVFTAPESIIAGVYDLRLDTGNEKLRINGVLKVLPAAGIKYIQFGDYTIMASRISQTGTDAYLASGNVNINGLARFTGDLQISGNYKEGDMLSLYSDKSVYMELDKKCDSYFAQFLSDLGMPVPLGKWGQFSIFNDSRITAFKLDMPMALSNIMLNQPEIRFYPDHLDVQITNLDFDLPFQDYLLKACSLPDFAFTANSNMILTTNNIALIADLSLESDDSLSKMEVLKSSLFGIDKFSIGVNTLEGSFEGSLKLSLKTFKKKVGVGESDNKGFKFEIKCVKWRLDELGLGLDVDVPVCKTPVPTTVSDFYLGAAGLSQVKNLSDLGKVTFTGGADINIGSLDAIIPGIKKLLGDVPSILQIDDSRASITLGKFSLTFTGSAKLFEELNLMNIELVIGNYDYIEEVLNFDEESVVGIKVGLGNAMNFDLGPISVEANAASNLYVNNKSFEMAMEGNLDANAFGSSAAVDGKMFLAIYRAPSGRNLLSLYIKGRDLKTGDASGFFLIVNKSDFDIFHLGEFFDLKCYR